MPPAAVVLIGTAHAGNSGQHDHVIGAQSWGSAALSMPKSVRWITARKILWAWILTIPSSAFFAFIPIKHFQRFCRNKPVYLGPSELCFMVLSILFGIVALFSSVLLLYSYSLFLFYSTVLLFRRWNRPG